MRVVLNLENDDKRRTLVVEEIEWYRFLERMEMRPLTELPEFLGGLILGFVCGSGLVLIMQWLRIF
jgi:hypothetical protein